MRCAESGSIQRFLHPMKYVRERKREDIQTYICRRKSLCSHLIVCRVDLHEGFCLIQHSVPDSSPASFVIRLTIELINFSRVTLLLILTVQISFSPRCFVAGRNDHLYHGTSSLDRAWRWLDKAWQLLRSPRRSAKSG